MKRFTAVCVLSLTSLVYACGDGAPHTHRRRAPAAITPPSRPLEWGDINVIHTTDTHGWLLGHQKSSSPEPNYSGTFGDLSSFVTHMKAIALKKDVDLLLVDSGDLHDGTGLTDGYPAGGTDGHESNKFFSQLPYDLLSIGNHELYDYDVTLDMYKNFIPQFKGRYLSSNANITLDVAGKRVSVPVGNRYAKFKTRKGRKVTSLGVLFNFDKNDHNTTVQRVDDMVKERWFVDAIKEEPDVFLLAGHMPVEKDHWPTVFNAIRKVHPLIPIMILGGHTHVRDCSQLDSRSMSLESGRYMETVGWLSAKLDDNKIKKKIDFSRRYMDANRVTYEYHTSLKESDFDTNEGKSITSGLIELAKKFNLGYFYGKAPHDFTLNQDRYPSAGSALTLFIADAVPYALAQNNPRAKITNYIIANSGSQRFDIYSGAFTKNDLLTASPYDDNFYYIPDIPFGLAKDVLAKLNKPSAEKDARAYASGYIGKRYTDWLRGQKRRLGASDSATLGYVTQDGCPGVGDDTSHTPLPYFDVPDFISSRPPSVTDKTPLDLVFVDFVEDDIITILNSIQKIKVFNKADAKKYSTVPLNQAIGIYAKAKWN
ncbi:Metallo-dependent phosphatase-like protein [Lyophyllum atratum]|nr:Metallo-dependent phosphatase-like protein [Lyophyllum atratum]